MFAFLRRAGESENRKKTLKEFPKHSALGRNEKRLALQRNRHSGANFCPNQSSARVDAFLINLANSAAYEKVSGTAFGGSGLCLTPCSGSGRSDAVFGAA